MSLKKGLRALVIGSLVAMLGGCGGGGGSKVDNTVVTGVVSKGIFSTGTVRIYAVGADGTRGSLLKESAIEAGGAYTADLGTAYTGPIQVEAFGTYADEATGASVTIPDTAPLKAAVPSVTSAPTVVVTPLTDLAVRKVTGSDGKLAVSSIASANTDVATLFGVDNIVTTKPVLFNATTLKSASTSQQKYTEVLALVSQYVANNAAAATPTATDLQNSLSTLSSGITLSSGGTGAQISSLAVAADLQAAVNDVTTNNATTSAVLTAADSTAKSNLNTVTSLGANKIVSYEINISGVTGSVAGVQADIALPSALGVADGAVSASTLAASGGFNGAIAGNVVSSVLKLAILSSVNGTTIVTVGNGNFATLYFKIPTATTTPARSELVVSGVKLVDVNDATVTGTITVTAGGTVAAN